MKGFCILSIFPDIFKSFLSSSLIAKAIEENHIRVECINFRDYAEPPHMKVDDEPYGGGAGMLLKPEPITAAIKIAKEKSPNAKVIYLSPSGTKFTQEKAKDLASGDDLILICGRYEGLDQRVIDLYVDEEISIGDFVCMGGETPAMVLIETIARLVDGVLGNSESLQTESFSEQLLEGPQYTRPREFQGLEVPEVLLNGNHQEIGEWRKEESLKKTKKNRPDLG